MAVEGVSDPVCEMNMLSQLRYELRIDTCAPAVGDRCFAPCSQWGFFTHSDLHFQFDATKQGTKKDLHLILIIT